MATQFTVLFLSVLAGAPSVWELGPNPVVGFVSSQEKCSDLERQLKDEAGLTLVSGNVLMQRLLETDPPKELTRGLKDLQDGRRAFSELRFDAAAEYFRRARAPLEMHRTELRRGELAGVCIDHAMVLMELNQEQRATRALEDAALFGAPSELSVDQFHPRVRKLFEKARDKITGERGVGTVIVRTTPPGAALYIDGTPTGFTPRVAVVGAGQHALTLTLENRPAITRWVEVVAKQDSHVAVTMPDADSVNRLSLNRSVSTWLPHALAVGSGAALHTLIVCEENGPGVRVRVMDVSTVRVTLDQSFDLDGVKLPAALQLVLKHPPTYSLMGGTPYVD